MRSGRSTCGRTALMRATALAGALQVLLPNPAAARLTQMELARVAVAPPPDARAPLDLAFTEADGERAVTLAAVAGGRPVLLLPVDYTCGNVCDPMLSLSAAALEATGLVAGRDYGFVLVGLDPRDDAAAARRMLAADLGAAPSPVRPRALVGTAAAVETLTRALGYGYVPDPGTDSIAHPAAAILLTPEGRVARILSPLALNGRDLRLALVEAGEGRTGSLGDRLALLCYGFDAARGIYTPLVRRILAVAGVATVLGIGLLVLLLARAGRVRRA